MQVHKLSALDAAGREFQQTKTSDKTMFLVPFAIAKATANLFSGSLANRFGRKRVGIVGWMFSVVAPMLAMSAVTTRTENESETQKWNRIVASGFFLGVGQGIGWTMAIMTSVDVSGPTRRGFASGMCETVGYTSVAFFAMMYALLEESRAKCHWEEAYRAKSMRTEACIRANPEGKCGAGDDWVEACSGMCNCEGYVERPSTAVFVLAVLGLVVICIFGRETGVLRGRQASGGSINAGNNSNNSNNNNSGRVALPVVRELETPGGGDLNDDESFNADEEEEESGTASFLQRGERGASSSFAVSGDPRGGGGGGGGERRTTDYYVFVLGHVCVHYTKPKPSSRRSRIILLQRRNWLSLGFISNLDARRARFERRTKRYLLWTVFLQQRHCPVLFRPTLGSKHARNAHSMGLNRRWTFANHRKLGASWWCDVSRTAALRRGDFRFVHRRRLPGLSARGSGPLSRRERRIRHVRRQSILARFRLRDGYAASCARGFVQSSLSVPFIRCEHDFNGRVLWIRVRGERARILRVKRVLQL